MEEVNYLASDEPVGVATSLSWLQESVVEWKRNMILQVWPSSEDYTFKRSNATQHEDNPPSASGLQFVSTRV